MLQLRAPLAIARAVALGLKSSRVRSMLRVSLRFRCSVFISASVLGGWEACDHPLLYKLKVCDNVYNCFSSIEVLHHPSEKSGGASIPLPHLVHFHNLVAVILGQLQFRCTPGTADAALVARVATLSFNRDYHHQVRCGRESEPFLPCCSSSAHLLQSGK